MLDFSKHKKGDVVNDHCCDSCAYKQGVVPNFPAESGVESWPCQVCGHYGIGSSMPLLIGDWLSVRVLVPNA